MRPPKKVSGTKVVPLKRNDGLQTGSSRVSKSCQPSEMTSQAKAGKSFVYLCAGCNKPIKRDKYLLKACNKYWHENCLKCDRCNGRLGELGSTLYCKSDMNLCRQDYLELFGETGVCSVCEKLICASEMVMRAKTNTYHLECFACQLCNQRFCVGDRFYLCENKVVCQYDYEEHILPIQRSLEQLNDSSTTLLLETKAQNKKDPPTDISENLNTKSIDLESSSSLLNPQPNLDSPQQESKQTFIHLACPIQAADEKKPDQTPTQIETPTTLDSQTA